MTPANNIRILVIEDHPAMAESIRQVMVEAGFDFMIVSSQLAIQSAREFKPHYILCDFDVVKQPDCGDLIQLLRAIPDLPLEKMIAHTVDPTGQHLKEAREFGFDEIWDKIDLPRLLKTFGGPEPGGP